MSYGRYERVPSEEEPTPGSTRPYYHFDCPDCRAQFRRKLRQLDEERCCEESDHYHRADGRADHGTRYKYDEDYDCDCFNADCVKGLLVCFGGVIFGPPAVVLVGIWQVLRGCWWLLKYTGPMIYDGLATALIGISSMAWYVCEATGATMTGAAKFTSTGAVVIANTSYRTVNGAWTSVWGPSTAESNISQRQRQKLDQKNTLYEYAALDRSTKQIRVLVLEPALAPIERLCCSMHTVSLTNSDRRTYEAISYCWGSSKAVKTMTIDGSSFEFPLSAVQALQHLRHSAHQRTVWIDAICINQFDPLERSQQVAIMGDIYRNCRKVLVWLGQGIRRTPYVLPVKSSLSQLNRQRRREVGRKQMREVMFLQGGIPLRSRTRPPKSTYNRLLRDFFDHPWFTRHWIVQEAALAPRGVFCCSQRDIPMLDVLRAAAWLQYKRSTVTRGVANASMIWRYGDRRHGLYAAHGIRRSNEVLDHKRSIRDRLLPRSRYETKQYASESRPLFASDVDDPGADYQTSLRSDFLQTRPMVRGPDHTQQQFPLTSLLRDFQHFEATEPRDKVYSLLGLSSWANAEYKDRDLLRPDYEKFDDGQYRKPLVAVYRDAVHAAIRESRTLDVLGIKSLFYASSEGPTWVPRLDVTSTQSQARNLPDFFSSSGASLHKVEHGKPEDLNTLICRGMVHDTVRFTSDAMTADDCRDLISVIETLKSTILPFLRRSGVLHLEDGGEASASSLHRKAHRALGLTLAAGVTYNGHRADVQKSHDHDWTEFSELVHTSTLPDELARRDSANPESTDTIEPGRGGRERHQQIKQHTKRTSCAWRFLIAMGNACTNRKLIVTVSGSMGLAPLDTQLGDKICVLEGGKWPFVLRKAGSEYTFIGPAYVHGLMYGGGSDEGQAPLESTETFRIR